MVLKLDTECIIHKGRIVVSSTHWPLAIALHGNIIRRHHTGTELMSAYVNELVKGLSFIKGFNLFFSQCRMEEKKNLLELHAG